VLEGISLTNPLGAWPASASAIGGTSPTNGAQWVDVDGDTFDGLTLVVVPPGGILQNTTGPYVPLSNYGAMSTVCPRSGGTPHLSYDYVPGADLAAGGVVRIKRTYTASRIQSSMAGTIVSCDSTGVTKITGTLSGPDQFTGPDGGVMNEPLIQARVGGCVEVSSSNTTTHEADCSATVQNELDTQSQNEHITRATVIIKRVASGISCASVRALTF
jgi:hypothetical protein